MTDSITVSDAGGIRTVTLHRPEKKNAITQAMYQAMADAIRSYGTDNSLRALVITGVGDSFTAGNDLMDFASGNRSDHDTPPVGQFLDAISSCPKPLIAAVNGMAIGVGLTMLLHCDLVYAGKSATFSAPFVKLGLVPEAASSMLLPASVGMAIANDILLAGRTLSADEAHQYGLVARVFDDSALMDEVGTIAASVAAAAPTALKRSKALIRHQRAAVASHMATEAQIFGEQLASPDFAESVAAMMEKRAPKYA